MKSFVIEKEEKLTKALLRLYNGALPYGTLMRLLKNKDVKVNGKRLSKDVTLLVGDKVDVYFDGVSPVLEPKLIFSSSGVFAFDKPSGITSEDFEKIDKLTNFIYESFDITFGNRILNQIENLVPVFVACGGTKEDALDFLLSRKVLAKVEGRFEEYVKDALKQFLTLLNKTYGKGVFRRCEATVNSIMRRL